MDGGGLSLSRRNKHKQNKNKQKWSSVEASFWLDSSNRLIRTIGPPGGAYQFQQPEPLKDSFTLWRLSSNVKPTDIIWEDHWDWTRRQGVWSQRWRVSAVFIVLLKIWEEEDGFVFITIRSKFNRFNLQLLSDWLSDKHYLIGYWSTCFY